MPLIYVPTSKLVRPRWGQRIARNGSQAKFPNLWVGKVGRWVPGLGITGDILHDLSGYGNDGVIVPTTTWDITQDRITLDLDGASGHIVVPDAPELPKGSSPFTVALWINPDIWDVRGAFVSRGIAVFNEHNTFRMDDLAGGGLDHFFWSNDLRVATADLSGVWHHVAVTYNGVDERIIYLDAANIASDDPGVVNVSATDTVIGRRSDVGAEFYNGKLDDIYQFNRALHPKEIRTIFENLYADLIPRAQAVGRATATPPTPEAANLPEYGQLRTAIGDPPVYGATILRS